MLNSHAPRLFVPTCDFVSTVGWGQGDADARANPGLPGGGLKYCVTPLCMMDFTEDGKRMRLASVHPGVTVEQARAQTGFELVIPDEVPVTAAPSAEALQVLRARVDRDGLLRRL